MLWYHLLALVALLVFGGSSLWHFFRIISLGNPPEYAHKAGNTGAAIKYSFTGAMSPKVKESAYLHLPTYTAGIIYHLGSFLAIVLFFLFLLDININEPYTLIIIVVLAISGLCGIGILLKRLIKKELRSLSNPDDYISNILVTGFQLITAAAMLIQGLWAIYFIVTSLLLLYFPLGKLKHAIYFFAARYHLGLFYGWRGVWPPKPIKK